MAILFKQSGTRLYSVGQEQWAPQLGGRPEGISLLNPGVLDRAELITAAAVMAGVLDSGLRPERVTFAQNANNGSGTTLASPARAHTTGNFLVVGVKGEGATTTFSVADTAGNTWVPLTQKAFASDGSRLQLFYAKNITGHASNVVTATWAAARDFRRMFVIEYSNIDTVNPLIEEQNGEGLGTALSTPDIATESFFDLIVAFAGEFANVTYTPGSGYTEVWDYNEQSGGSIGGSAVEEQIISTAGGDKTVTMTQSSSADWGMVAASFRAATAGGGAETFSGTLASAAAGMSGAVSVIVSLSGTLASPSATFSSALSIIVSLSGALSSQSATTASALSIIAELSGSLSASASTMAGAFDVGDTASFSGTLGAQSSSISAAASILVSLSGTLVDGSSSLSAAVSVIAGLSGTLAAQSASMSGSVGVLVGLSGTLAANSAAIAASLAVNNAFAGTLASGSSTFSGLVGVGGEILTFLGNLEASRSVLLGDVDPTVSMQAALYADPARLDLEWLVRLGDTGTGWRKDRHGFNLSLGKRR